MEALKDPQIDELFIENRSLRNVIYNKKITTLLELLLFTPRMIEMSSGLGTNIARYVVVTLGLHGMSLRDPAQSIEDVVIGMFGSIEQAPVVILNFTLTIKDGEIKYKHLRALNTIPASVTVGELKARVMRSTEGIREADNLVLRMNEWGIFIK